MKHRLILACCAFNLSLVPLLASSSEDGEDSTALQHQNLHNGISMDAAHPQLNTAPSPARSLYESSYEAIPSTTFNTKHRWTASDIAQLRRSHRAWETKYTELEHKTHPETINATIQSNFLKGVIVGAIGGAAGTLILTWILSSLKKK